MLEVRNLTMNNNENRIWEVLNEYKISKISFHYLTDIPIYNENTDTEDYTDGNVIDITGCTKINHIQNTSWQIGSEIILHFACSVTLTHAAGTPVPGGSGTAPGRGPGTG